MNTPKPSRPWIKMLAIVAAIVVAVIGIAWVALTVLLPPERVRSVVQAQLSRSLDREVRFDGAGVGLFPPVRLTVSKLAISEAGGFKTGTAIQAASIHLDLDVMQLLGRKIVVRRLVLDQPSLHLVLKPDGTTNLDGIVKPEPKRKEAGTPMDMSVDELTVRQGRLLVDDLKASRRRTLVVDTRVSLASRKGGTRLDTQGHTTLSKFAFGPLSATRISDLNQGLAPLELVIDHRGAFDAQSKRLALERLDLGLGHATIGVTGIVDDVGPQARIDMRARGSNIDFGEVLGALAAAEVQALHGVKGSGRLDFDLAIRGTLPPAGERTLAGALKVTNASFRYPGAPASVDALTFTARFAPDSLGIGDLVARVQGQPVRAALSMTRFSDPVVRFAIRGNVDLATVAPLVAPKDTKLAGRVALDVKGSGRVKQPEAMALDGAAKLTDVSVQTPQVPKKIESLNGTMRFSAARAEIQDLRGKADQSSFQLDARVTRPLTLMSKPGTQPPSNVDFDFRSPYLDLADFMPSGSGPLIVPNATGGGRVSIGRLKNEKLDVQHVTSKVGLDPGVLRADQFSMSAYEGIVSGSAQIDVRDPKKPAISLDAKVDSLSADAILSTWTPAKNFLRGRLNSGAKLSLQGATPQDMLHTITALGAAEILSGQVGPGPVLEEIAKVVRIPALDKMHFDQARMPFRVENGRVVTGPATMAGRSGKWNLLGSVGFDGSLDYAVSITLPKSLTQNLDSRAALAAGALADEQGNLLLDLRVGGSAKQPRVALDTRAMQDRLAGKVSQAIEEQKQKIANELQVAADAQRKAVEDSVRRATARMEQAVKDSLQRRARDVLKGFFGGATQDTTARP